MLKRVMPGGAGTSVALLVIWAALCLDPGGASAAVGAEELLERVRLHDRQLEAVEAEYSIHQAFQVTGQPPTGADKGVRAGATVPKSHDIEGRFVRDGQKVRGDRTTTIVGPDDQKKVQQVQAVFDGEVVRQYEPNRKAGIIAPPTERDTRLLQEMHPLHWGWSYGAQPLGDFLASGKMTVTGTQSLDGVETTVVDFTSRHNQRFKLWIVPAWGYRFKKLEKYDAAGKLVMEYDAQLTEQNGVWFPSRGQWRLVNWQSGGLPPVTQTATLEVKSVKVNQPVPPEEFALEFPSGTLVMDHILNTGYRLSGKLVDPTGTDPVARLGQSGLPAESQVQAAAGQAGRPSPAGAAVAAGEQPRAPASATPAVAGPRRSRWLLVGAAGVVVVGLGLATWRLAARRRRTA